MKIKQPFSFALFFALMFCFCGAVFAQQPVVEENRNPLVTGIKITQKNNPLSFPVARLGEAEALELHFDELGGAVQTYWYSLILCDANWVPANLSPMDYLRGFTQNRITNYRAASGTQNRYVHYQAFLPASNSMPTKSGNYLLKVFKNGDTLQTVFTRRILIAEFKATVGAVVQQPFANQYFNTHQKVVAQVSPQGFALRNPATELKVQVMQNNNWTSMRQQDQPTFIRGNTLEYSNEEKFVFEGGKEWRWLDLRSFRLQSDRVAEVNYDVVPNHVFVIPDTVRSGIRYQFFRDMNGSFQFGNLENINPYWQSDYADVYFTFLPQEGYKDDMDYYLFGELTGYQLNEQTRMKWNPEFNWLETHVLLKNGFYNYAYVSVPKADRSKPPGFHLTEGNRWETENNYRIMVYYRPFGARSDELIGVTEINSLNFLRTDAIPGY